MKNNEKRGIVNGIRHILAAALFCMIMSMGIVCFADEQGTVTVASAKIRASADASSEQLGSVEQGKTVDIIGKTTGADGRVWYQVYVNANTKGFIRGDLVRVSDSADIKTIQATDTTAQGTDTTPTTATSVEAKRATVVNSNVRIRKGASTNHDVVATANRGMVVTVTGETNGSDGKKWYQVSFTYNDKEITGFIRSDLVTFENVPADVAESQITGEENPGEGQTQPETAPAEEPSQEEQPQPEQSAGREFTPMQGEELPYLMAGFKLFKATDEDSGQSYEAYINGNYFILYGQRRDGETGWFLFDKDRGVYIRYPYTTEGMTIPNDRSVGMVPVIVMVVIIIILVAAVGLLLLKLRENTVYGRSYGRDDDSDDDIEDLEELEDEDDEDDDLPVGRPQGRPVRRPQPQGQSSGGQPARRPQPQGGQQPGRRPQRENAGNADAPQGTNPQGRRPQPQGQSSGGQPVRRPQPQGGNSQTGARPQGPRPANGQPNSGRRPQPQGGQQSGRRPQPQNDKAPVQKGYKAKNLLEDDDDMDFMDI